MDDQAFFLKILILFIIITISGCGGGSGSSNPEIQEEFVLDEPYSEQAGDTFTTSLTMDTNFSPGEPTTYYFVNVRSFSTINEIPQKYGYSNAIAGPYLLETSMSGDNIGGLKYSTLDGKIIIDDSLIEFTNVEYTTQSGSEAPVNIRIGDNFSAYNNSRIFDSESGEDIGYEITEMSFSVISEEKMATPVGEFEAVKLSYTIENSRVKDETVSYSGSGYTWYDTNKGLLLKSTNDIEYSTSIGISGTVSSTSELQSYSLVQKRTSSASSTQLRNKNSQDNPINVNNIFNDLRMNLNYSQLPGNDSHTN